MTGLESFEFEGKTYTLDQQCGSILAGRRLEMELRKFDRDYHFDTLIKLDVGGFGVMNVELADEMKRKAEAAIFHLIDLDPPRLAKFERTLQGIAAVLSVGCVEIRDRKDSLREALRIVTKMEPEDRIDLLLKIRVAKAKEQRKN